MSNGTHALTRALGKIASSTQVSSDELEALCNTHGKRVVLRALLARCSATSLREYEETMCQLRRTPVFAGQEDAHAKWLAAAPVRVAAWAAMRSFPVRAARAA